MLVILLVGGDATAEAALGLGAVSNFVRVVAVLGFLLGAVEQSFGEAGVLVEEEIEVTLLEVGPFF